MNMWWTANDETVYIYQSITVWEQVLLGSLKSGREERDRGLKGDVRRAEKARKKRIWKQNRREWGDEGKAGQGKGGMGEYCLKQWNLWTDGGQTVARIYMIMAHQVLRFGTS